MSDLVSAQLSESDVREIKQALQKIKNTLPFMVSLSPKQRQTLPKMDDSRRPFVEKALQYGENEPNMVPPYIELKELKNDLQLFGQLQEVFRESNRLNEMISDTLIAASADAYSTALTMYNSAKTAAGAGVHGMDTVVADLKRMFETRGSADASPEEGE